MKKRYYSAAVLVAVGIISGCGSSTDSGDLSGSVSQNTLTEITVQRGPVLNAYVVDSKNQIAKETGNGKYVFENKPEYPVKVLGGFIDINRDGVVDEGDINNTLIYETTDGNSVTLVSSIAKKQEIRQFLKEKFSLSDEDIDNKLPDENKTIAAISDEVFAYCIEHNITDATELNLSDVYRLKTDIEYRLQTYTEDVNRSEVEARLVQRLRLRTLKKEDIEEINQTGESIDINTLGCFIDSMPEVNLSVQNKEALSHMWNEEKLAHDLYLKLYELYPNSVLYTIATRSEARHEASMENLIKKYDLNITSDDFSGSYNPDELSKYGVGEFILPQIQQLYNELYTAGEGSEEDALKVGCMVEVTDVDDINRYLQNNETTPDMKIVLEHLKNGSYHHYWAFDRALKSLGVSEGCCSLGEDYCKTEDEYPKVYGPQN